METVLSGMERKYRMKKSNWNATNKLNTIFPCPKNARNWKISF